MIDLCFFNFPHEFFISKYILFFPPFRENPDAQLEIDDIIDWEQKHGRIPNGAILIMNSGTGKYYNNKTRYFGWPNGMEQMNPQDTENLHFPGIDPQAAGK